MNSFFARQLFVALALGAQDLDLTPVARYKSGSEDQKAVSSLSHKNARRVKRYREKHTRDEVLKRLARDIIEKKRHKMHLENAIQSMHTKLDGYAQTLDKFIETGKKAKDSSASSVQKAQTSPAPAKKKTTTQSSSSRTTSRSRNEPSQELSILKTQLDYLERKLELIRKSKGVDDNQYETVKSQIERLSKLVEKKEQQFSVA